MAKLPSELEAQRTQLHADLAILQEEFARRDDAAKHEAKGALADIVRRIDEWEEDAARSEVGTQTLERRASDLCTEMNRLRTS